MYHTTGRRGPRIASAVACLILFCASLRADVDTRSVVKIPSHGLSGVVVYTSPGLSYVISAAHGWADKAAISKPVSLEYCGKRYRETAYLVYRDVAADVVLLCWPVGNLPYVARLAPPGASVLHHRVVSAGFDAMWTEMSVMQDYVIAADRNWYTTCGSPYFGRSGGALFDADSGELIGITHGVYIRGEDDGREVLGYGVYVTLPRLLDAAQLFPPGR
jgi:hypothetical protein